MTEGSAEPTDRSSWDTALHEAQATARAAYRDSARLIRLLGVLGTPSTPEELLSRSLIALSEVFIADVTCVAEVVQGRLVATSSCGLPENDPAYTTGWPVSATAQEVFQNGQSVAKSVVGPDDVPSSLAPSDVTAAAWVPLSSTGDAFDELLILYRRRSGPFTPADMTVLASVAGRMSAAVESRERNRAVERLAEAGPNLARHLDLTSLLDETVLVLRQLTGTDAAWIVTISDGQGHLSAHTGLTANALQDWPRPVHEIPRWSAAAAGEPYAGPGAAACENAVEGQTEDVRSSKVLCVPVMRDQAPVALLCANGRRASSFGTAALEVTTILGNYLAVAMSNCELYGTVLSRERELHHRATTDPLTGLANRVVAAQRLNDALRPPRTADVGVLFCDLDKFKEVNDRLGHEAGDELLQRVADRLRLRTRPGDLVARFGGDEFVFVVDPCHGPGDLVEIGHRLQSALTEPIPLRGEWMTVTVSTGGVIGRSGQTTASALLRDADAAMYAAKARGPGQVEVFDEAASHRSVDRLDLRSDLSQALSRDELRVVYQPIVALRSGTIVGFEALTRWHHRQRGVIAPDIFIPMAEESEAIVPIGAWVLDQACRQLKRWQRGGHRLQKVAVNVSAIELAQPDVVDRATRTIEGAGVPPDDVWLEVTEHSRLTGDLTDAVTSLRDAGVHFALDDFGMSYSSLDYLQRFPVETVKIDKSFVAGVTKGDPHLGIVRAIMAIARSLQLGVIAEGIETPAQRSALIDLGCSFGQGYLYSRPLTADEATRQLDSTAAVPSRG